MVEQKGAIYELVSKSEQKKGVHLKYMIPKEKKKIRLSTDCVKQIPVSTKIWLNTDVVTLLV
jgi:uncharacterized protein YcfJ